DRAQLRVDRFVPSGCAADSPWTTGIFGRSVGRVVLSLSMGEANGVNRRQVEDVETHRGDVGKQPLAIAECSVLAGLARRRPREHFVPGAKASPLAVDSDGQFPVTGRLCAIGVAH